MIKDRTREQAGRLMIATSAMIARRTDRICRLLGKMECEGSDAELVDSVEYQTLLATMDGLVKTLDKMNKQLNKFIK